MGSSFRWWFLLIAGSLIAAAPLHAQENFAKEGGKKKPNVLFIVVDDLRPEMGCYGNKIIKTPNLDRLAADGVLCTKHFVQASPCGPSRAALLTGLHPQQVGVTGWIGC